MAEQQSLPIDLLLIVIEQVDDLPTLGKLAEAYPYLLLPPFKRSFDFQVVKILIHLWPEELYHYACIIMLAATNPPKHLQDLKEAMGDLIKGSAPITFPTSFSRTLEMLHTLISLVEATEFFVHFCSIMYLQGFGSDNQTPLSPGEIFRIRRALLRFQLYAQLFHQPEATDEIVSDRDWESRPRQEHYFWTRFESVEVEECKCIYFLLVNVLANIRPIRPSNELNAENVLNVEMSSQRGLPLLQQAFSNVPLLPLASSYAERFVDYAFTGLDKVDPHDGNYFLPYMDFQNPDSPQPRMYRSSEAYREKNFGVKMHKRPKKYHPVVRRGDRSGWRMIGYCFWDEDRVEVLLGQLES